METFVTIMTNAVYVFAFLTVLAVVSIVFARFTSGNVSDHIEH